MTRALYAPRPGVPLQAAVDRAHGHGLFLPTLTGDAVTSSATTPLAATAVTGGTAHTKGAWVQVTAATTAPVHGFHLCISTTANYAAATDTSTLLDIGIGGAGSEVVVVPNIGIGYQGPATGANGTVTTVPVTVPQGSRVAIRAQSIRTSRNITVWMTPIRSNTVTRLPAPTALIDLCANTATSYGVALSVPGGANTKGAWTQLTASVPQALQAVVLTPQAAADTTVGTANGTMLVDVAVGASGSEQTIISNWPYLQSTNEVGQYLAPTIWPVTVPAGARLAARYQTPNTGNSIDLQVIGVPA